MGVKWVYVGATRKRGGLPEATAEGMDAALAWVLAAAVVVLAAFGVLGEMRGSRRPAPGR